jgi:hypothetical protein
MTMQKLYDELTAADRAWNDTIEVTFGGWPGDHRYRKYAEGDPGTKLRTAYDAFNAARRAFDEAGGWAALKKERACPSS